MNGETEGNGVWFPEDGDSSLKKPDRKIDRQTDRQMIGR